MQTQAKKGFTLIELLVVIVIIGILATISVATFSGYFKKARDSERQAAIRNMATLLKTARAVNTITSFDIAEGDTTTAGSVEGTLFSEGGYSVPAASTTGYTYVYVNNGADQFAFFTCSEENSGTPIVDGTAGAVADITADTLCDGTGGIVNVTESTAGSGTINSVATYDIQILNE